MMKKTYMSPLCEEIKLNSRYTLLSGSGVSGGDGLVDAGYGGIDENGELDPASREFDDEWDEDFDEEDF